MHDVLFALCVNLDNGKQGCATFYVNVPVCMCASSFCRVCINCHSQWSSRESLDSCGTSAPSLDSTDHHAAAAREGLFPSFITSSLLYHSLGSLSFCHP